MTNPGHCLLAPAFQPSIGMLRRMNALQILQFVLLLGGIGRNDGLMGCFTPNQIHYMYPRGRTIFFEALNLSHRPTVALLAPLLRIPLLYLRYDYHDATLDGRQAKALVNFYIAKPKDHELVLPTIMVSSNKALLQAVRRHWRNYCPGPIYLRQDSLFTVEELRQLLAVLGPHPEYCGSCPTALHARSVGWFENSWEVTDQLNGPSWPSVQSVILYAIDEALHSESHVDMRFLPSSGSEGVLNGQILAAVHNILNYHEILLNGQALLAELKKVVRGFSRKRRVLWELKLVFLVLETSSKAYKHRKSQSYLQTMTVFLGDFLNQHSIHDMPEFLLRRVLTKASFMVDFREARLEDKLHELQERYESAFCLGGRLTTRLLGWKKFLRTQIGSQKDSIIDFRKPIQFAKILHWWCDYSHLSEVIYREPQFEQPLVILFPKRLHFNPITIHTLPELLHMLSPFILWRVQEEGLLNSPLQGSPPNPHTGRAELLCYGLARCIAAHVLYHEALDPAHVGLDPSSPQEWPFLNLDRREPMSPCQKILRRTLYSEAHINTFVPWTVLLPDSQQAPQPTANDRRAPPSQIIGIVLSVAVLIGAIFSAFDPK